MLHIHKGFRYAYFKKLDYFSTECVYSPDAYRGHARAFLKDLEAARPSAIIDIIHSGEAFEVKKEIKATQRAQREFPRSGQLRLSIKFHALSHPRTDFAESCGRCGYMSSNPLCKACTLLEGLERGMAESGLVSYLLRTQIWIFRNNHPQTERARKKLEAEGPAPDNIRMIPYFNKFSGNPKLSITVETSSS